MNLKNLLECLYKLRLPFIVLVAALVSTSTLWYSSLPVTYTSHSVIVLLAPALRAEDGGNTASNALLNFTDGLESTAYELAARVEAVAGVDTMPALSMPDTSFELRNTATGTRQASSPFIEVVGKSSESPSTARLIVEQVLHQADMQLAAQQRETNAISVDQVTLSIIVPPTEPTPASSSRVVGLLVALALSVALSVHLVLVIGQRRSSAAVFLQPAGLRFTPNLLYYYLLLLAVCPAGMVWVGLPVSLSPATTAALWISVYYFCGRLSGALGLLTGRTAVRCALVAYLYAHLATYASASAVAELPADEMHAMNRTLINIIGVIAVGLLVTDVAASSHEVKKVLVVATACCSFVALVGFLQFAAGIDFTRLFTYVPLLRPSYDLNSIISRANLRRPASTAAHPIEFGVVCAMLLPVAAHLTMYCRQQIASKAVWSLCTVALLFGVVVSISRSAIIALIVASLVASIGWTKKQRIGLLLGALLSCAITIVFAAHVLQAILELFASAETDPSVLGRLRDYDSVMEQFGANPVLGRGAGTWLSNKYNILDNQYLLTVVESGSIGLLAYVGLFGAALFSLAKSYRRSILQDEKSLAAAIAAGVCVAAVTSTTFDFQSFPIITGIMFVLLGCSAGMARPAPRPSVSAQSHESNYVRP